jgi:large subunit ribosomal protein L31
MIDSIQPLHTRQLCAREQQERIFEVMKAGIHPAYNEVNVICACGSIFRTRSTHKGDLRVEICSSCHPFFTGRQKLVDTEGRVDRFQKKFAKARELQAQKKAASEAKAAKKVQ